jgi:lipopolysaccharide export LptBFGC system permease protein LptF
MTTACDSACGSSGCKTDDSVLLLKKIESMISDNYTMLFILLVVLLIVGFALIYFVSSLGKTLQVWWKNKQEKQKALADTGGASDNPRSPMDDDVTYYENPKDDPDSSTDPFTYAPKGQRDFDQDINATYQSYNEEKTQYIATTYNGKKNDDILDRSVMYKEYDDYSY